MNITDVIFTHIDPDNQKETVINITRLSLDFRVKIRPIVKIPIDPVWAEQSFHKRGLEEHRLKRIILRPDLMEPVLFCVWPDGSHLLVDGNHRYAASWVMGATDIPARIIPRSVWKKHVIKGLPASNEQRLLTSFSGIP